MSVFDKLSTTQKRLASISGIIIAVGIIVSTAANALGVSMEDFHIATSNDVVTLQKEDNKIHLRIAETSQYGYEQQLRRIKQEKYDVWEREHQYQLNNQPAPPQLKQRKDDLQDEERTIKKKLDELDSEINQRKTS